MALSPEHEAQILRYYHAERWRIGTIAVQLGLHRDTVARVLAQAGLPRHGPVQRASAIDPYLPFLHETLAQFPRLTAARLYDMVRARGYPGRPDHFRHLIARHRPRPSAEAYLRLRTLPGEQAQVDWGHFGHLTIGRARRPLMAFVMVLSWSRQIYLRFFLDARMENFLRGHVGAFAHWGAVLLLLVHTQQDLSQALQAPLQLPVLRSSLQYGVPLMLSGLAYWGLSSADRWLLKLWGNLSELGVYSMAISLGAAALIVQNIFATVWSPTVFKWVKEERNLEQISKVFGYMLDLVVAVLCCVGLASPVIPFFLPAQYADVQFIVLSSMLFPLLYTLTEISGIGINVCKQTWINTLISVVALLIHVVLCYGLIPAWGAKGAAMALAMAFWLFYVAKTEVSMRLWLPLPRIPAYGITLAALLLCLAYTYAGNTANYGFFAVAWGMVLLGLAWKYRHLLRRWLPI